MKRKFVKSNSTIISDDVSIINICFFLMSIYSNKNVVKFLWTLV